MRVTSAPASLDAPESFGDDADSSAEAPADAVVVRLGEGRFSVALEQVAEVGKVPAITRVPGVPAWLAGVVNWRGRILPVLDVRTLLGAEGSALGSAARLVVLITDVASVGMLADAVEGAAALGPVDSSVPPVVAGLGAGLIRGHVVRDDGPIAVVDVDAVMRLRDALPRGRRGES
jgi:purine-binding chemotaxis protein CheW